MGTSVLNLNGLVQYAVEPLNKESGILERNSLHEERLIEEQPSRILSYGIAGTCKELFDNFVIRIDLERGFQRREIFLPHGA